MSDAVTDQAGAGLDQLRERMDKAGFSALLLTSPGACRRVLGSVPDSVGGSAVVLTAGGRVVSVVDGDLSAAIIGALHAADVSDGEVGVDADLPWEVFREASSAGPRLRPAADLVFAELASCTADEVATFAAAADLAGVGYTAVMDHLHVGMDVRELSGNVDRSIRRAGGCLGWYDPVGTTGQAGSDLVTVRGHDPGTAKLTAETPVRYVLHPLLGGVAGYAGATAVLSKADPALRAAGETCAAATASLLAALRPGALIRDGYDAFGLEVGEQVATCRIVALRGGGATPALPRSSAVVAQSGMVLGIRTGIATPGGGAIELAETVVLTGSGADLLARTPLRLVELY
jgi:Xaa-Pro aminopeptidase